MNECYNLSHWPLEAQKVASLLESLIKAIKH